MATITATGVHVRHAISRALATENRSLQEATFRVLTARVEMDSRGRVNFGEVTLRLEPPQPLRAGVERIGVVNPDGLHPLMAPVPRCPGVLMDIFPVTYERWVRVHPEALPDGVVPATIRVGVGVVPARSYAQQVGKRLPTAAELRAAWGPARWPWGDAPGLGRTQAPRFGEIPEAGLLPPSTNGFFDLGGWLYHWVEEEELLGGAPDLTPGGPDAWPYGFRCVQNAMQDGERA